MVVKVRACGVCGTDINFVRDWPEDPMPLGHEIAAEVVEIGKNVPGLKAGDRVIVEDCYPVRHLRRLQERAPGAVPQPLHLEGQPGMGEYLSVRFNSLVKFEGLDFVVRQPDRAAGRVAHRGAERRRSPWAAACWCWATARWG